MRSTGEAQAGLKIQSANRSLGPFGCLFLALVFLALDVRAQIPLTTHYRLLDGSTILDDCAICDRAQIFTPLTGEFDLVQIEANPLFVRYKISGINFVSGPSTGLAYVVTGEGELKIGGEVAVTQQWTLNVEIKGPAGTKSTVFTNDNPMVERVWPNLAAGLTETRGTLGSTFHLRIQAAPLREIWFLTSAAMNPSAGQTNGMGFEPGDVLADAGRIVKTKEQLLTPLALSTPAKDLRLDALDVRARFRFSLAQDAMSAKFGAIHRGDLVASYGIVASRQQLLQPFGVDAAAPDPGLDAAQMLDYSDTLPFDIYFSIRDPVFSPKLGRTLGRGDLLVAQFPPAESTGAVRKTNRELLGQFHPAVPDRDYGLDAVYVWRHGEIWFSTEEGFQDSALGPISDGDLLSDQGYVVFRNAQLVQSFNPPENSPNFGLVGLDVMTDAGWRSAGWVINPLRIDFKTGDVLLSWRGTFSPSKTVQVERAAHLGVPFQPISPIMAETEWTDAASLRMNPSAIYRLRQW